MSASAHSPGDNLSVLSFAFCVLMKFSFVIFNILVLCKTMNPSNLAELLKLDASTKQNILGNAPVKEAPPLSLPKQNRR